MKTKKSKKIILRVGINLGPQKTETYIDMLKIIIPKMFATK
jgi:hypothetical protein